MSIKDNIKEELISIINIESHYLKGRKLCADGDELYQIRCEENFIEKLRKFAESI